MALLCCLKTTNSGDFWCPLNLRPTLSWLWFQREVVIGPAELSGVPLQVGRPWDFNGRVEKGPLGNLNRTWLRADSGLLSPGTIMAPLPISDSEKKTTLCCDSYGGTLGPRWHYRTKVLVQIHQDFWLTENNTTLNCLKHCIRVLVNNWQWQFLMDMQLSKSKTQW